MKLIIDTNLLNQELIEDLKELERKYEIHYFSLNENIDFKNNILYFDSSVINKEFYAKESLNKFYKYLALMTNTTNIDSIIFISNNQTILYYLSEYNFKTLLVRGKRDYINFTPYYEIPNTKKLTKLLGGLYENSVTKRK